MKIFLRVLAVFLLAVAAVQAQTSSNVVSPNIVGFVKVDLAPNALKIIATPLNPAGSGTTNNPVTLDALLGTNNLTATGSPNTADQVHIWTGSGYADAFLLNDAAGDTNVDWKWCFMSNGDPVPCASTNIYNVSVGQGLWLFHRGPATTIYLQGEVPMAPTSTVAIAQGLNMIANPYPVDKNLDDLISTNYGAHATGSPNTADQVHIWTGNGYADAFLLNDAAGDTNVNWKWCFMSNGDPVPCASTNVYTLKPGQGAWYQSRGGSFNMNVPRPY